MTQITSRELLEVYRKGRTADEEIALIEFMELSEHERWELIFIAIVKTAQETKEAMKRTDRR
jgi:hypothetical protein